MGSTTKHPRGPRAWHVIKGKHVNVGDLLLSARDGQYRRTSLISEDREMGVEKSEDS